MTPRTALVLIALSGCAGRDADFDRSLRADDKLFSSEADFLVFEWDGELEVNSGVGSEAAIQTQLLYTVGQLNGEHSVARLDQVELSDITRDYAGYDRRYITYHARMTVAWDGTGTPGTYELRLPFKVDSSALNEFKDKYEATCTDAEGHSVTYSNMWYYFRPMEATCDATADLAIATATVSISPLSTTDKYPEYDMVWEDDALKVVAVFGKYTDGATSNDDAGIAAYNSFVSSLKSELSSSLHTAPENVGSQPGAAIPDITFYGELSGGRSVEVTALLIDAPRSAGASFDARYEGLTPDADLILYNGHAGLGANVRALADKGEWERGQYAIFFVNGCDTFAYLEDDLFLAHADVNPDDPTGTKHLDMVANAMPAYFSSMPTASMALIRALLDRDDPWSYKDIFDRIDDDQVVVVTGEEDNSFTPDGDTSTSASSTLLSESGSLSAGETDNWSLAPGAGHYSVDMTGTGDADLYVRVGAAPTSSEWDCRPYSSSSNESCDVDLSSGQTLYVAVMGYAGSSTYTLTVTK